MVNQKEKNIYLNFSTYHINISPNYDYPVKPRSITLTYNFYSSIWQKIKSFRLMTYYQRFQNYIGYDD